MKNKTIIFTDSAENTANVTVNRFGKKMKFDNGGYRVALVCGEIEAVYFNTRCPDQFAGECFSVLKAVEFAKEQNFAEIVIRNDRVGSFKASTKRGYIGATYLWLAEKMAKENNIAVEFEPCTSEENLADGLSRRQGTSQGIQTKEVPVVVTPDPVKESPAEDKPAFMEIHNGMSRTAAEHNLKNKYNGYHPELWTDAEKQVLAEIKARNAQKIAA